MELKDIGESRVWGSGIRKKVSQNKLVVWEEMSIHESQDVNSGSSLGCGLKQRELRWGDIKGTRGGWAVVKLKQFEKKRNIGNSQKVVSREKDSGPVRK